MTKKRKLIWLPQTARSEDISDEQYFQDEPWCNYISNSKLGVLDPNTGGSIELFKKSLTNKKRSKAFNIGTITHSLLLQENNYGVSDVMAPSGKAGQMTYDLFKIRCRTNPPSLREAINLVVQFHNYYNGKPLVGARLRKLIEDCLPYYAHLRLYQERDFILNSEEVNVVFGALESLKGNSDAMTLLFPENEDILRFNEMAIAVDVKLENTPYTLKIKIDNWTLDVKNQSCVLNDLKTTGVGLQNFVNGYWEFYPTATEDIRIFHPGSFQKYKYYRQLAMYAKVLSLYVEKEYGFKPKMNVNIVAVETKDPYWSEAFNFGTFENDKFSLRQLDVGLQEMERLLWILKDNNYVPETGGVNQQPLMFV